MAVQLKTAKDMVGIWRSCRIAAGLLVAARDWVRPGATTGEINQQAIDFLAQRNAKAAFLGYNGFPGAICTSINDEVVHGIPGDRQLKPGDIFTIDVGAILDGYVSDTASTYFVGEAAPTADQQRLLDGTRASLVAGINSIEVGKPLRKVSRAIEQQLRAAGLGIVRELTGHGVGFQLHEEPTIYNFDTGARQPLIQNGMVLAIEPMASLGSEAIILAGDNWTYRTADGSLAAHFEHTVAIWDDQAISLTDLDCDLASQVFGGMA